jgi:hypothetical protein
MIRTAGKRENQLLRSKGLAMHEHLRLVTLLIPLLFPPIAFDCLALPPACCVADHRHCDVEEAEAELCCGHDVPFPAAALSAQR